MSKAILIMDMPSSCVNCDFCVEAGENDFVCRASMETEISYKTIDFDIVNNYDDKAIWCPLREVPQKKDELAGIVFNNGYNACIDEILGGGE